MRQFEKNLNIPEEFINGSGIVKMNYKQKAIELRDFDEDFCDCALYLNDEFVVNVCSDFKSKKFYVHDFDCMKTYGLQDTMQQAVKEYMDARYN